MLAENRDPFWLVDMLQYAQKVEQFTAGRVWEEFEADEILQNAVYRLLIVIGEAASQVTDEGRASFPEVPWRQIVGMRHKLVHHYFRIDPVQAWDVVVNHIGPLIENLASVQLPPKTVADEETK